MARAAASTSFNTVSTTKLGLTSTAIRVASGTNSCRSSNRLVVNSSERRLMPVRFPPGLATANKTISDRVNTTQGNNGNRRGRCLRNERCCADRNNHGDLPAHQFIRQHWQSIKLILGPAIFNRHVLALDIPGIFQTLAKCAQKIQVWYRRCRVEETDDRHRRLLRARRERPRRCAAKQRDELAALYRCNHSITSSASASSAGDNSRPSALAAVRLSMSSYLVGCWNGRSPGFSPRKMRST